MNTDWLIYWFNNVQLTNDVRENFARFEDYQSQSFRHVSIIWVITLFCSIREVDDKVWQAHDVTCDMWHEMQVLLEEKTRYCFLLDHLCAYIRTSSSYHCKVRVIATLDHVHSNSLVKWATGPTNQNSSVKTTDQSKFVVLYSCFGSQFKPEVSLVRSHAFKFWLISSLLSISLCFYKIPGMWHCDDCN